MVAKQSNLAIVHFAAQAIALLALPIAHAGAGDVISPAPTSERQRAIVHLVRQDCGACHGMTLQGGLGPPLTPEALAEKPTESLVATICQGRAGTPMPPFAPFLSEDEARWIVERLKQGFPSE
ncbi:c-type cytochrome [Hydrogenophilus thermoluteolus]|uniref:Cytochrome c n=1 Tax=Hydrogenophilus thermoluteolus TaxID=297 RepID=A0A2Z6DXY9_HYDTE|nr:cytochrome c [Hydrogenophilus thermoluteolus]BBD77189.1 cytochrome c [Hydrogenophilus thermoluteolus]